MKLAFIRGRGGEVWRRGERKAIFKKGVLNDVKVPSKSMNYAEKLFFLKLFFVGILKVNDETRRIRIRIRIQIRIRIRIH